MTRKLTARMHVRAPPRQNVVPTESHSNGQRAGYLPKTLQTLLLALGYGKAPLFIRTPRLIHGELIPMARTCGDIREVYDQSYLPHPPGGRGFRTEVDVLRHEEDDQMEHLQYHRFLSHA
jgi:hypothetical protein